MRSAAAFLVACSLVAACGDPFPLPQAGIENKVDTVFLYALSGTPVTSPSAYALEFRQVVRTDQATGFDFAFDIDSTGQAKLFPTGALRLGRQSGIQLSDTPFDSIRIAPTGNYELDSAVAVDTAMVAIVHSRPLTCSFGIAAVLYAKLHVLSIDTTSGPNGRRIQIEILTDVNCGYRGLETGLPRR
jgi:hypothetical protein